MHLSPDVFLDCIILLINDNSDRNRAVVNELIQIFEDTSKGATTIDNDLTTFYVRLLKSIMNNQVDRANSDQLITTLLAFKSDDALKERRDVYDLLERAFASRDVMEADQLGRVAKRVQTAVLWHRTDKILRNSFGQLRRSADYVNPDEQEAALNGILRTYEELQTTFHGVAKGDAAGLVDCISFSNRDSLRKGLERHRQRNVLGVIRFGRQGLNRMFGYAGGAVRGESITFNALPHNYKSEQLMDMAEGAATYNSPVMEGGKKPIILFISLENEAFQNMMAMFRKRYFQETGLDPRKLSDAAIEEWIYDFYAAKGFELVIERHLPSAFGYDEFVARVRHYEDLGFVIYLAIVDYLNLAKKSSNDAKASNAARDLAVRDLFSKICNFTKSKGITFITAHPLNRKASELANSGKSGVVRFFATEHLADSMDVEREVDVSIYQHIERNYDGIAFLTWCMKKHRYVNDTPLAHKSCAYPFSVNGIMDDIGKPPGFVAIDDMYSYTGDGVPVNDNEPEITAMAAAVF